MGRQGTRRVSLAFCLLALLAACSAMSLHIPGENALIAKGKGHLIAKGKEAETEAPAPAEEAPAAAEEPVLEAPATDPTAAPVERVPAVVDMNIGPGAAPMSDFNVVEPEYKQEHAGDIKLLIPGHLPLILPKGTLITLPGTASTDPDVQHFDVAQEAEAAAEEAKEEVLKEEAQEGTEIEGGPEELEKEEEEEAVLESLNTNNNANANANVNANINANVNANGNGNVNAESEGYAEPDDEGYTDTTEDVAAATMAKEEAVEEATEAKIAEVSKKLEEAAEDTAIEDDDGYSDGFVEKSSQVTSTKSDGSLADEIASAFADLRGLNV